MSAGASQSTLPGTHSLVAIPPTRTVSGRFLIFSSLVEFHTGAEPVDARGHRGGESADAGHRVHPADEQGEPLTGRGVVARTKSEGASRPRTSVASRIPWAVRWYLWLGRQVGGAVVDPPNDALLQQVGQGAVDGRVWLAGNESQLRRIDEGRPAEGVVQLLVGYCHGTRITSAMWKSRSSGKSRRSREEFRRYRSSVTGLGHRQSRLVESLLGEAP